MPKSRSSTRTRRGAGARAAWLPLLAAALLLAGCFESDAERARRAYEEHDFATASSLAAALAEDGQADGFELLALMAAQGLGRDVDYGEALALADRAAAADPAFAATRGTVEALIEASWTAAQAAFKAEDYERAYAIAEPLERFGRADATALRAALVTAHQVPLPGSELTWLTFWNQCSGNTRYDSDERSESAFATLCLGHHAVWDGTVVKADGGEVMIKMTPGRPGTRHDLTLKLDGASDPALAVPGRKVRFAGVIAARGNPNRADTLEEARLIEAAPLSVEEGRAAEIDAVHAAMRACQELAEVRFRERYMPDWAVKVEEQVRAGGSPKSRAFSLFVGVVSEIDAFQRTADGGWHGVWDGTVTIQSVVARTAQVTEFTADCAVDPTFRRGEPPAEHATLAFLKVGEPKVESAPGRLRTPR